MYCIAFFIAKVHWTIPWVVKKYYFTFSSLFFEQTSTIIRIWALYKHVLYVSRKFMSSVNIVMLVEVKNDEKAYCGLKAVWRLFLGISSSLIC